MSAEKPADATASAQKSLLPTLAALRAEQWLKKNMPSLDAYNAFVEKYGVFSDGIRDF